MTVCQSCSKTFLAGPEQLLCNVCIKSGKGITCGICGNKFLAKGEGKKYDFCDNCISFLVRYKEQIKKERREKIKQSRLKPKISTIPAIIEENHRTKKGNNWLSLRFLVLARDNFTCGYCGRTPGDGAKLMVDHIYPKSKGGDNEEKNLLTACDECNLGKSDILLSARQQEKLSNPRMR